MSPAKEICADHQLEERTIQSIAAAVESYRRQFEDEERGEKWSVVIEHIDGVRTAGEMFLYHLDSLGEWGRAAFHEAGFSCDAEPYNGFATSTRAAISQLAALADAARNSLSERMPLEGVWGGQGSGSGIGRASVHWAFPVGDKKLRERHYRSAKDKLAVAVIAALARDDILKREKRWTGKAKLERFLDQLAAAEKLGRLNWDSVTRGRRYVRMFAYRELVRERLWDRSFRRVHGRWPADSVFQCSTSRF